MENFELIEIHAEKGDIDKCKELMKNEKDYFYRCLFGAIKGEHINIIKWLKKKYSKWSMSCYFDKVINQKNLLMLRICAHGESQHIRNCHLFSSIYKETFDITRYIVSRLKFVDLSYALLLSLRHGGLLQIMYFIQKGSVPDFINEGLCFSVQEKYNIYFCIMNKIKYTFAYCKKPKDVDLKKIIYC